MIYYTIPILTGITFMQLPDRLASLLLKWLNRILAIISLATLLSLSGAISFGAINTLDIFQIFISSMVTWLLLAHWKISHGKEIAGLLLLTYGFHIGFIMSEVQPMTSLFWILEALPVLLYVHNRERNRTFILYQVLGVLLFILGKFLPGTTIPAFFLIVSLMVRQGEVPFHSWILADRKPASLSLYIQFLMFNSGVAYYLQSSEQELNNFSTPLTVMALLSGLYLSALSWRSKKILQKALLIVFAQSSLILAGVEAIHYSALGGSLLYWLVHALGGTSFLVLLMSIVERKGIYLTGQNYGIGHKQPLHAYLTLFSGLVLVGAPLTLGFVGEDVLFHTFLESSPFLGFILLVISALNSFNILSLYSDVFLGPEARNWKSFSFLSAEYTPILLVVIFLIAMGLAPGLITKSLDKYLGLTKIQKEVQNE